jgi:disulfide bond formation protein DsbB
MSGAHRGNSMMPQSLSVLVRANPVTAAALAIAAGGIAVILGALFFEYVLGQLPCPLCLMQRKVCYAATALGLLVAAASAWGPRALARAGLVVLMLLLIGGAGLAAYHAGVEWHFWPGPQDCSGPLNDLGSAGGLLKRLQSISIVRCDQAGWRFLGLSLAGWNVLISLALATVALWGIRAGRPA